MNNRWIVIFTLIIIAVLAYGWFVMRSNKVTPIPSVGETGQQAAQSAAAKPFTDTKTNPFSASANPLQGYKNPFSQ